MNFVSTLGETKERIRSPSEIKSPILAEQFHRGEGVKGRGVGIRTLPTACRSAVAVGYNYKNGGENFMYLTVIRKRLINMGISTDYLKELIKNGEGIDVEFKESKRKLNKDAFDSICAFLNRNGGHLILGVDDGGNAVGIDKENTQKLKENIITQANNPQKLSPPVYLSPEIIKYQRKQLIYCRIPESSQVHNTNGKIFDRNEDGDFNITSNQHHVSQLYKRKSETYSENDIYPHLQLTDLNPALFIRLGRLASSERPDHPWLEMTDVEILESSGL